MDVARDSHGTSTNMQVTRMHVSQPDTSAQTGEAWGRLITQREFPCLMALGNQQLASQGTLSRLSRIGHPISPSLKVYLPWIDSRPRSVTQGISGSQCLGTVSRIPGARTHQRPGTDSPFLCSNGWSPGNTSQEVIVLSLNPLAPRDCQHCRPDSQGPS